MENASENGDLPTIKTLVSQGANIHRILYLVAYFGHLEIVKYLVSQGADIHTEDDRPLHWASSQGHLEIVVYLVSQGADIHAKDELALKWAVSMNHAEIVSFLMSQIEPLVRLFPRNPSGGFCNICYDETPLIQCLFCSFQCCRDCKTRMTVVCPQCKRATRFD